MAIISICIPAYKRVNYLKRLLESTCGQTFKDFEVIVTDDSPDDAVAHLCDAYKERLHLKYYKNNVALGTPANWNEGISRASGEWIKLMHDDDWFVNGNSLQTFYYAAIEPGNKMVCAAYYNVFEPDGRQEMHRSRQVERGRIVKEPLLLLSDNIIGPPSVTMIHKSIKEQYDNNMKWRVDIDFYISLIISEKKIKFIDEVLINVGISESQVTNSCINLPEVELPEGFLLLKKYGVGPLNNIHVYDAWWRILRNVGVRGRKDLERYTPLVKWPVVVLKMLHHQAACPASILKIGVVSKLLMVISYLRNRQFLHS